ncbi:hypothetical protein NL676_039344 [Syzygium grande]|nr:hypothetical protein NL676_039344 [Syzygium grande]
MDPRSKFEALGMSGARHLDLRLDSKPKAECLLIWHFFFQQLKTRQVFAPLESPLAVAIGGVASDGPLGSKQAIPYSGARGRPKPFLRRRSSSSGSGVVLVQSWI